MITFQWIPGAKNLVDFLSKNTVTGDLCYKFVQYIFCNYEGEVEDRDLEVGRKI